MQDTTHVFSRVSYPLGEDELGVGDSPVAHQEGEVHPVMEAEHFPERRHTFSGQGLPSIVVTSKYSAEESRDYLSSNLTRIN